MSKRGGVAAEMDPADVSAWVVWAQSGGRVRLVDGRIGRLMYFAQGGGRHKVFVCGHHERVANDWIECAIGDLDVAS